MPSFIFSIRGEQTLRDEKNVGKDRGLIKIYHKIYTIIWILLYLLTVHSIRGAVNSLLALELVLVVREWWMNEIENKYTMSLFVILLTRVCVG